MKYPKAGDLQRKTQSELTGNPWEVRSESGLEGVFANEDDARFYADELRGIGARTLSVTKRTRFPQWEVDRVERAARGGRQNPARIVLREPWTSSTEIIIEEQPYGYTGWLQSSAGRLPISFGREAPSNARESMELAKKFLRSAHGKSNPEETFDIEILAGMERALWVTSWADWVENLSKEERKQHGVPVSLSGLDFSKAATEAPPSALLAAQDLYLLIERANGKTPGELFQKACEVDGCEWDDENAETFGHYLAMQSLKHGVSWFDDHKEFPIKFPRSFEAHYMDGDLWWSPQVQSRQNGVRR